MFALSISISVLSFPLVSFYFSKSEPSFPHSCSRIVTSSLSILFSDDLTFLPIVFLASWLICICSISVKVSAFTNSFWICKLDKTWASLLLRGYCPLLLYFTIATSAFSLVSILGMILVLEGSTTSRDDRLGASRMRILEVLRMMITYCIRKSIYCSNREITIIVVSLNTFIFMMAVFLILLHNFDNWLLLWRNCIIFKMSKF